MSVYSILRRQNVKFQFYISAITMPINTIKAWLQSCFNST